MEVKDNSMYRFQINSFFFAFAVGFITMELYLLNVNKPAKKNAKLSKNRSIERTSKVGIQDEPENSTEIHTGG